MSQSAQPGQVDSSEALLMGVQLHQQGYLDAAQELYRRLLELDPRNADALHCMGVLLHARGRSEEAIDWRLVLDGAAILNDPGVLRAAGLVRVEAVVRELRTEVGLPVQGWLISAQRESSADPD